METGDSVYNSSPEHQVRNFMPPAIKAKAITGLKGMGSLITQLINDFLDAGPLCWQPHQRLGLVP